MVPFSNFLASNKKENPPLLAFSKLYDVGKKMKFPCGRKQLLLIMTLVLSKPFFGIYLGSDPSSRNNKQKRIAVDGNPEKMKRMPIFETMKQKDGEESKPASKLEKMMAFPTGPLASGFAEMQFKQHQKEDATVLAQMENVDVDDGRSLAQMESYPENDLIQKLKDAYFGGKLRTLLDTKDWTPLNNAAKEKLSGAGFTETDFRQLSQSILQAAREQIIQKKIQEILPKLKLLGHVLFIDPQGGPRDVYASDGPEGNIMVKRLVGLVGGENGEQVRDDMEILKWMQHKKFEGGVLVSLQKAINLILTSKLNEIVEKLFEPTVLSKRTIETLDNGEKQLVKQNQQQFDQLRLNKILKMFKDPNVATVKVKENMMIVPDDCSGSVPQLNNEEVALVKTNLTQFNNSLEIQAKIQKMIPELRKVANVWFWFGLVSEEQFPREAFVSNNKIMVKRKTGPDHHRTDEIVEWMKIWRNRGMEKSEKDDVLDSLQKAIQSWTKLISKWQVGNSMTITLPDEVEIKLDHGKIVDMEGNEIPLTVEQIAEAHSILDKDIKESVPEEEKNDENDLKAGLVFEIQVSITKGLVTHTDSRIFIRTNLTDSKSEFGFLIRKGYKPKCSQAFKTMMKETSAKFKLSVIKSDGFTRETLIKWINMGNVKTFQDVDDTIMKEIADHQAKDIRATIGDEFQKFINEQLPDGENDQAEEQKSNESGK